jgi:hypothetical protein
MYHAQPFQAFDIHLSDGRSLPVEHPEVIAITPSGRIIAVALADGTFEIVDVRHVESLKPRLHGTSRRRQN